jgi:CheY-like chemotaxis protein
LRRSIKVFSEASLSLIIAEKGVLMLDERPYPPSTILLIEADPSLRRLMTLGLQHNGMDVVEGCSLESLVPMMAQPFDLVVLDVDRGMTSDWSLLEKIQANPHLASLPIVVLSWDSGSYTSPSAMFSPSTASTSMIISTSSAQVALLDKPFDARALYHTIQKLLASRAAKKAAMEALAEARVLAMYSQHTAPSVWPVVTAAGLLLAFIGLLLHVVVVIMGLLIVMVALLVWTLGIKPEAAPIGIAVASQ